MSHSNVKKRYLKINLNQKIRGVKILSRTVTDEGNFVNCRKRLKNKAGKMQTSHLPWGGAVNFC